MTLKDRMKNNNFIINGGPCRCSKCEKPNVYCVQEINNEYFLGPMCPCFPMLKKKYSSREAATNALLTRSYKEENG